MSFLNGTTLGSVISIKKGRKHFVVDADSLKSRRLIGIDDLRNDDLIRFTDDKSGTEAELDDLLIAWDGANAGTIGFGKSGLIGSTIARLRPKEKGMFYTPFLGAFLQSKFAYLRQTATGATIPHVNRKALESIVIPDISVDDQRRIADLLYRVKELIVRRKQQLQQLDDLLKSVFLDLFSPHSPGYDTWPLVEIKDLAANHKGSMRTGPFGSNLRHSEFSPEGDVAVLGIDNAVENRFTWGKPRFISKEKYKELKRYRIYPGDVIVTIMGTIGRSAVIPGDIPVAINTKHLAAITLNNNIADPLFISYSIHSSPFILNQFKSKGRGAIMSGLNLGIIKTTKLKKPPIDLQNEFSAVHKKVDRIKSRCEQSLTDLESLYASLSQKAFKGELDLSRIPLPIEGPKITNEEPVNLDEEQPKQALPKLPAPAGLEVLQTVEGRKELLFEWLDSWVVKIGDASFSAQEFMETAQQRVWELTEDERLDWGLEEYDELKKWVFQQIQQRRIKQTRNIVLMNEKRKFGNDLVLRARKPKLK